MSDLSIPKGRSFRQLFQSEEIIHPPLIAKGDKGYANHLNAANSLHNLSRSLSVSRQ
jgi:hypothetical protein